jgi:hypothetical protein
MLPYRKSTDRRDRSEASVIAREQAHGPRQYHPLTENFFSVLNSKWYSNLGRLSDVAAARQHIDTRGVNGNYIDMLR